ncbi:hypothetical protein TD95_000935 [Thielaviopsis punctulata]|uniref:Ubiquitin carboxyl-terminal hydrolase n=1 Tax=Thielaviopsis punctulata TaxID=72032 RepID=A0A0F4ZGH0_9PEZI|nr:hypothetical protein TD95_000935 [Thielaviopsis punctulata]
MPTFSVTVKHRGKKYDIDVDPESTGEDFKLQLFSLTAVEPSRQKIILKGLTLKDEVLMKNSGIKPGQSIMMMGTPSDDPAALTRPKEPIKFAEDLEEQGILTLGYPAGIQNLGNTCYLNSTVQLLNAIPELVNSLGPTATPSADAHSQKMYFEFLKMLKSLKSGRETLAPINFLGHFRAVYPQFSERSKTGHGFAQQDAEEAMSQILAFLKRNDSAATGGQKSIIDKYMTGSFKTSITCDEGDDNAELATGSEDFTKLSCHITSSTNHLSDSLKAALTERIEKKSERLGRDAMYTKTMQISRLPRYLTMHFVRFFWKRDTQKKAKIMRKVTFPQELDLVEYCSPELREKLIPVRDKVREVRKDEEDIERSRKRRKTTASTAEPEATRRTAPTTTTDGDTEMGETFKTDAQVDAEKDEALKKAKAELKALLSPELAADEGASQTGIYELRAVVTHQGASADSGHYTAYVKKEAVVDAKTGKKTEDGSWWWFNDDKVSEVGAEKIEGLAGGGETHSALVLLYRSVAPPVDE